MSDQMSLIHNVVAFIRAASTAVEESEDDEERLVSSLAVVVLHGLFQSDLQYLAAQLGLLISSERSDVLSQRLRFRCLRAIARTDEAEELPPRLQPVPGLDEAMDEIIAAWKQGVQPSAEARQRLTRLLASGFPLS